MPTRLYLPSSGTGINTADITPSFDAAWNETGQADRAIMPRNKTSSIMATKPADETNASSGFDFLARQYISEPLASGLISGFVSGQMRVAESAAQADFIRSFCIRVIKSDGTLRGYLVSGFHNALTNANEYGTSLTNRFFPPRTGITALTGFDGDRIVYEIGTTAFNAVTTLRTVTYRFGDSASADLAIDETTTTDNNPWLEFNNAVKFQNTYSQPGLASILPIYKDRNQSGKSNILITYNRVESGISAIHPIRFINKAVTGSQDTSAQTGINLPATLHQTGHFIVVNFKWEGPSANITVTDTAGNTYTPLTQQNHSNGDINFQQFYAKNIVGNPSNVIKVGISGSGRKFYHATALQYSGVDTVNPLQNQGTGQATNASDVHTQTFTTNYPYAVLVAGVGSYQAETYKTGLNWNQRANIPTDVPGGFVTDGYIEDIFVSLTGTYSGFATQDTAGVYLMNAAAFRAASGIINTIDRNESGLARILQTTDRTQSGISKIQATIDRTESGIARVQQTTDRTQSGLARIQQTTDRNQSGVADIKAAVDRTQSGLAKILATIDRTESGKASITITVDRNQTGLSFIKQTTDRTESGISKIQQTTDRNQSGVANIKATIDRSQSGLAKVGNISYANQSGVANVQNFKDQYQTGNAFVHPIQFINKVVTGDVAGLGPISGASTYPTLHYDGNLLVVNIKFEGAPTTITITDTANNTYIPLVQQNHSNGDLNFQQFYAKNIVGNTGNVVSVSFLGDRAYFFIAVLQYTGVDRINPFQAQATGQGNNAAVLNTETFDTSYAYDLFVAGIAGYHEEHYTPGPLWKEKSYIPNELGVSPISEGYIEDRLVTQTGTYSGVVTQDNPGEYLINVAAFKAASPTVLQTTDRNESGLARVLVTNDRTESGQARIKITSDYNQSGIAKIQQTTDRNESGLAKVQQTTDRNESGLAKVQQTIDRNESGISRVLQTYDRTQSGVSTIKQTTDRNESGLAKVKSTYDANISGVSRIKATADQNQSGLAKIKVTTDYNASGLCRILVTIDRNQTGIAKIQATIDRTQSGVADIKATINRDQSGVCKIGNLFDRSQSGLAKITNTYNTNASGIANIKATIDRTESGQARISNAHDVNQSGLGKILSTRDLNESGVARVQVSPVLSQSGISKIRNTFDYSQSGVARVLPQIFVSQSGLARISIQNQTSQSGLTYISHGIPQSISGLSYINSVFRQNNSGVCHISNTRELDKILIKFTGHIFSVNYTFPKAEVMVFYV
jgi:septal ring factor EnvC (AmiA/AmiB activator)